MGSLLLAGLGSLLGCDNPSSKDVATMIAEPQGEGVASLLRGIDYKVNGTQIDVGNHRLEVFPYVEQCTDSESDHVCGVRFEVSTEGKKQPALTYGVVGTGKTMDSRVTTCRAKLVGGIHCSLDCVLSREKPRLRGNHRSLSILERWRFEALLPGGGSMAPRRCTEGSCRP